jgi:hypothetical protein
MLLPRMLFEMDPSISLFYEKTKFGNFNVNIESFKQFKNPKIDSCLHEIQPGICAFCKPNRTPSVDRSICELCLTNEVFFPPLNQCIPKPPVYEVISNEVLRAFNIQEWDVDPYDIGDSRTTYSFAYGIIENAKPSYSIEDFLNSYYSEFEPNDKIHMVQAFLTFSFYNINKFDNPFYGVKFSNSDQASEEIPIQIDSYKFSNDQTTKSLFTNLLVFQSAEGSLFNRSNLFYSVDSLTAAVLSSSSEMNLSVFDQSTIKGFLKDSVDYSEAKVHPVTFPLSFKLNSKNVYVPHGLFEYVTFDVSNTSLTPPPGFYFEEDSELTYLKKCPDNCVSCSSSYVCNICRKNYIVSNGMCVGCSVNCFFAKPTSPEIDDIITDSLHPLPNCESNEFFDSTTSTCLKCSENCVECSSSDTCVKCKDGLFIVFGKCIKVNDCELPNSNGNILHSSCTNCPSNCLFCSKNSSSCSICNPGYYKDGTHCLPCPENCSFCLSPGSCLRCDPTFQLKNGKCINIKITHEEKVNRNNHLKEIISDNENNQFEDKETEIKLGNNENPKLLNCSKVKLNNLNKCYLCNSRFYLGSDYNCYPCSSHCATCRNNKFCLKCDFGFELKYIRETSNITCAPEKVA